MDEDIALLDELVAAWRETRDPMLESPIARLGRLLASQRPLAEWDVLVTEPDAVAITQLMDLPWPEDPEVVRTRLAQLVALPDDPRITTTLAWRVGYLVDGGASYDENDDVLGDLNDIMFRAPTALAVAYAKSDDTLLRWNFGTSSDDWPPPIKPAPPALLARFAERMPADIDGLYAAVYANPGDVGARLVLADALQQIGDPRGEFIALQCAITNGAADASAMARTEALLERHRAEWIGPLPGGGLFENGFVAQFYTQHSIDDAMVEALLDRPEWSTIHTLHVLPGPLREQIDPSKLIARLPILRRLRAHKLDWLTSSETLECIGVGTEWSYDPAAFPKLRVLARLSPEGDLAAALEAAKASRLDAIAYWGFDADRFAEALAIRDRGPSELRLVLRRQAKNEVFVRIQGAFAAVHWQYEGTYAVMPEAALASLRDAGVTRVALWCDDAARANLHTPRSYPGLEIVDGAPIDLIGPFVKM